MANVTIESLITMMLRDFDRGYVKGSMTRKEYETRLRADLTSCTTRELTDLYKTFKATC